MPLTTSTHSTFDNRPIGVFDSGVGGLSIATCIKQRLPSESIIYVADALYAPYGDKSTDFIQQRVKVIAQQLLTMNVKALVLACNTATVNAVEQLREMLTIPIIGVEPAIKPACIASKTKKVAILSTQSTASNPRFLALVSKHKLDSEVIIQPCPGLVEVIESGNINNNRTNDLLNRYLTPLLEKDIDHLVLGCTHYPFLSKQIKAILGSTITLVETAQPVTKELMRRLAQANLLASIDNQANYQFLTTLETQPSIENQQTLMSSLWGEELVLTNIRHTNPAVKLN